MSESKDSNNNHEYVGSQKSLWQKVYSGYMLPNKHEIVTGNTKGEIYGLDKYVEELIKSRNMAISDYLIESREVVLEVEINHTLQQIDDMLYAMENKMILKGETNFVKINDFKCSLEKNRKACMNTSDELSGLNEYLQHLKVINLIEYPEQVNYILQKEIENITKKIVNWGVNH